MGRPWCLQGNVGWIQGLSKVALAATSPRAVSAQTQQAGTGVTQGSHYVGCSVLAISPLPAPQFDQICRPNPEEVNMMPRPPSQAGFRVYLHHLQCHMVLSQALRAKKSKHSADGAQLCSAPSPALGQHPEHYWHPCHLQAEDGLALVPKEVLLDVLQENKYLTTPGGETWEPLFKEHNTIKGF